MLVTPLETAYQKHQKGLFQIHHKCIPSSLAHFDMGPASLTPFPKHSPSPALGITRREGRLHFQKRAFSLRSHEEEGNGNRFLRSVCYLVIQCTPTHVCTHLHNSQHVALVQILSSLFGLVLFCSTKAVLIVTHYLDFMSR